MLRVRRTVRRGRGKKLRKGVQCPRRYYLARAAGYSGYILVDCRCSTCDFTSRRPWSGYVKHGGGSTYTLTSDMIWRDCCVDGRVCPIPRHKTPLRHFSRLSSYSRSLHMDVIVPKPCPNREKVFRKGEDVAPLNSSFSIL